MKGRPNTLIEFLTFFAMVVRGLSGKEVLTPPMLYVEE